VSSVFPDKDIRAELYYLRSGKRKHHTYTKEDIEQVKEDLLKNINEIIEDNSFSATGNERICTFCEHAASGACATGVNRLKRRGKA
jgi:CRISPR/Cas system-associated exonuclease Cas4 (RecB family)